MKRGLLLLALAASLAADETSPAYPTSDEAAALATDRPWVVLRLTEDRRLRLRLEHHDQPAFHEFPERDRSDLTLERVGDVLDVVKRTYRARMERRGERGTRVTTRKRHVSLLPLVIEVDRDREWLYVEWVIALGAEIGFLDIHLRAPDASGATKTIPIPIGEFDHENMVDNPIAVRVRWHDDAAQFGTGPAGEFDATRQQLDAWIDRQVESDERDPAKIVAEIRAHALTPVQQVVDLWTAFRRRGFKHIHTYGFRIPHAAIREARVLPPIERDRAPLAMAGTGGLGTPPGR